MPSLSSTMSSEMTTAASQLAGNGSVTTGNIVIGVVVELVIMLLILGNLLMVITLLLYKPWTIPDLLLFSLSLADVINGTIPVHILNIMNNFYGKSRWTSGQCALFIWMTFSLRMTSVCTITLISAERMILLTKPLQHKSIVTIKKARIAVIAVWFLSGILAAFPYMGIGRSGFRTGYCYYQLYDLGTAFGATIETIGIFQLIVVLACFISIKLSSGKFIKRQSVMAASNQTGSSFNMKEKETAGTKQVRQLSKMMAIVVLLYYISWLPYLLTNFVSLMHGHLPYAVDVIVGFLSLVSAIINPLLYGKISLRYRRGYQFIFKKIRSLCGGEKPDGNFFNDRRRGSYSTTYTHTMKRASVGSTLGLEVNQHINKAYNDDERNYGDSHASNNNDDIDEQHHDVQEKDDDNEDIAIYPVDINNKDCNDNDVNDESHHGDDDDHDDTQITICPLSESHQFAVNNEGLITKGASVGEDEGERVKASTVEEEDFSICPYEESIIAHFEGLRKLAHEEESDLLDTKDEIVDGKNKQQEGDHQMKEHNDGDAEGRKEREDMIKPSVKGSGNAVNVRGNDEDDINIPGTVMGIDKRQHAKNNRSRQEDGNDDGDNDDDHDDYHVDKRNKENHMDDTKIDGDDDDDGDADSYDDTVDNDDENQSSKPQQSTTITMPASTDRQEALPNQAFESNSQSEARSQDDNDASDSFGEGSILGNYDITQPETDTEDEDEDEKDGYDIIEVEKMTNEEEEKKRKTKKEENALKKNDDDEKGRKGDGKKEEEKSARDGNKESKSEDVDDVKDKTDEREKEETDKEEEEDSSSKASVEGSYDIMGDLLEETPSSEQQTSHGHFFVDDIVKRMAEDKKQRLSMDSYDLLHDGNSLDCEEGKLDHEHDMSVNNDNTASKADGDKKDLASNNAVPKDVATAAKEDENHENLPGNDSTIKNDVTKINTDEDKKHLPSDDLVSKDDAATVATNTDKGKVDEDVNDKMNRNADENEMKKNILHKGNALENEQESNLEENNSDEAVTNGTVANEIKLNGTTDEKWWDKNAKQRSKEENYGVGGCDSAGDDGGCGGGGSGGVDDDNETDRANGTFDKRSDDKDDEEENGYTIRHFREEHEPNFIVDESIFKGAKVELSGRKKYTRKTSDPLRKELGEI